MEVRRHRPAAVAEVREARGGGGAPRASRHELQRHAAEAQLEGVSSRLPHRPRAPPPPQAARRPLPTCSARRAPPRTGQSPRRRRRRGPRVEVLLRTGARGTGAGRAPTAAERGARTHAGPRKPGEPSSALGPTQWRRTALMAARSAPTALPSFILSLHSGKASSARSSGQRWRHTTIRSGWKRTGWRRRGGAAAAAAAAAAAPTPRPRRATPRGGHVHCIDPLSAHHPPVEAASPRSWRAEEEEADADEARRRPGGREGVVAEEAADGQRRAVAEAGAQSVEQSGARGRTAAAR